MTSLAAKDTKAPTPKLKKLYLINRDFQLRYTKIAVAVGLVSTALTLFLILFPLFQFQIIRFPNFLPAPFLWAIALAALLNFAIVATMGILVTHRIAGPMFSLVREFRQVQDGRFTRHMKIREGDDLKYVVRNYNEMIDQLAAFARKDLEELDALIPGLAGDSLGKARQLRDRLAARIEEGKPS